MQADMPDEMAGGLLHRSIARFAGKRVMVTGRAFGAITAHHHAPIDISEIDLP